MNADSSGRCINTLDADDLKIILASCRDEVERQTVRQYIAVQENSGAYSYQVATSGHTYTIEQGFIKPHIEQTFASRQAARSATIHGRVASRLNAPCGLLSTGAYGLRMGARDGRPSFRHMHIWGTYPR